MGKVREAMLLSLEPGVEEKCKSLHPQWLLLGHCHGLQKAPQSSGVYYTTVTTVIDTGLWLREPSPLHIGTQFTAPYDRGFFHFTELQTGLR